MRSSNGNAGSLAVQLNYALRASTLRSSSHAVIHQDAAADYAVLMSIRVDTAQLATARRTLHQWLGPDLDIYTAVIDNKNGRSCLQIEIGAGRVSETMSLIMRTLPEAEFGAIRPSPRAMGH
jgi:hypothetical protein